MDPCRRENICNRLVDLSQNLWWCWHPEVTQIFREIDPELWSDHPQRSGY
ncbi:MAG: DUF3417 domain-containing protein [Planctomycetales bacterium]